MRQHQPLARPCQPRRAGERRTAERLIAEPCAFEHEVAFGPGEIARQPKPGADIGALQLCTAAIQLRQPQRTVQLRGAAFGGDLAVERRSLGAAAIDPRAGRGCGKHAGKAVVEPPLTLQLHAHGAVIAFQQPARIANRHIDRGQRRRLCAVGEDQRIERAEAQFAAGIAGANACALKRHPPHFRSGPADAEFDHQPPHEKIGPRRIADHEVLDHLGARGDADDVIARDDPAFGEIIVDHVADQPLAADPRGTAAHQRHGSDAEGDSGAPKLQPRPPPAALPRFIHLLLVSHRHCSQPLRVSPPKGNVGAG